MRSDAALRIGMEKNLCRQRCQIGGIVCYSLTKLHSAFPYTRCFPAVADSILRQRRESRISSFAPLSTFDEDGAFGVADDAVGGCAEKVVRQVGYVR